MVFNIITERHDIPTLYLGGPMYKLSAWELLSWQITDVFPPYFHANAGIVMSLTLNQV
jgi:hypothetical protein